MCQILPFSAVDQSGERGTSPYHDEDRIEVLEDQCPLERLADLRLMAKPLFSHAIYTT